VTRDVNAVWLELLDRLLRDGTERAPRGQPTRELLAYQTVVPMSAPVVTVAERKLGRRFLTAEAAWILSGDNRVSSIAPYSKEIVKFSDDGLTFRGAYGPKFVDQVSYVVQALREDTSTRQAVINLWRERPGSSLDHPCTTNLQWLIRDEQLHCVTTMRSSDVFLGWVYDTHTFSMMSAYVLLSLRQQDPPQWDRIVLGDLYLTAGSQHLYERDRSKAAACLNDTTLDEPFPPYPLDTLRHPEELVKELWRRANG